MNLQKDRFTTVTISTSKLDGIGIDLFFDESVKEKESVMPGA